MKLNGVRGRSGQCRGPFLIACSRYVSFTFLHKFSISYYGIRVTNRFRRAKKNLSDRNNLSARLLCSTLILAIVLFFSNNRADLPSSGSAQNGIHLRAPTHRIRLIPSNKFSLTQRYNLGQKPWPGLSFSKRLQNGRDWGLFGPLAVEYSRHLTILTTQ